MLIAHLAMLHGRPASRDKLCGLLWSERSQEQARGSLRQALASLKRLYGDIVLTDSAGVVIPLGRVSVDALPLIAAAEAEDWREQVSAAALYQGPFLAGYDAPDPGAEDWLFAERERVRRAAVRLVDRLTTAPRSGRECGQIASGLAYKVLAEDPACEEAHRALIGADDRRPPSVRTLP